ncbi:MAG TPA: hypothetical protein P5328_00850 [Candidatus Paceibacterota bacterium]|nr:hypothetical protein [Candidatus Paceibacterota bacterium]HRZ34538.1 hypothetical protein [Candidatus Paceibacterota bacterium]
MVDKNLLQDVIPPATKRSIRDIPVPARKKTRNGQSASQTGDIKFKAAGPVRVESMKDISSENLDDLNGNNYERSRQIRRYLKIFGAVVILIALFILFSNLDSAQITIEPKTVAAVISKSLSIGDLADNSGVFELGYRTIELNKEVSKEVVADDEEFIQTKATGVITIYNEYSNKTQNLIKNTRFETADGLIYTITASAAVPGYKVVNDEKVPGSIDAKVVASNPGEEYNIDSAEFTIPGFKGQEPYDFFYAKTKTAMSGGFDGVKKIVSEEKLEQAEADLVVLARNSIVEELKSQISDEFVALFDENSFQFGEIQEKQYQDSNDVTLSLKGSIAAKIFNKTDLSGALALDSVIDYSVDEKVLVQNIEDLSLKISGGELLADESMTFTWQNDEEDLRQALAGKKKSEFGNIIKTFPGIAKASLVIKPFWKTKFPKEVQDIDVEVLDLTAN